MLKLKRSVFWPLLTYIHVKIGGRLFAETAGCVCSDCLSGVGLSIAGLSEDGM